MDPTDLLASVASAIQRLGLRYLVTGSMATITYGEPRLTNDIAIVVELPESSIDDFLASFPESDYYWSAAAILEAVRSFRQFNILHPSSGLKIDFFVASESEFDQSRLGRGRELPVIAVGTARFATPEDVILKKLDYFQQGGSDKHIRDILGVLRVQKHKIDVPYITEWAQRLGLSSQWELVLRERPA